MTNISIFAQKAFLNTDPKHEFVYTGTKPRKGYLKRVSSIIRADQVALATNAKINPRQGYKKDVCIYIKPELDTDHDFKFEGDSSYLDVIDELGYAAVLKKHPKVCAIVLSERDFITLASVGVTNKIVIIPQHHCNFERKKRTRKKIITVGVIGNYRAFPYLPAQLKQNLSQRNMKLLEFSQFFTRQDVIDFYKSIDIQIVWRPYLKKLANPLKIVNAASFGIPTIALDEIYFKELGNCYIGVRDFNHFLIELDRLRASSTLYDAYSKLCLKKAENYHIEEIAKLYKNLR
ncbi:hypothetical protein HYW44_00050 [Candidatus Daviesbacteria bacterium]|nr:hypothetical protein [Candidatus Daviesbacteria bacterium]